MSGGKASRQKGNREERRLVALLQTVGFAAERTPLSGAVGGRYSGDISVPLLVIDRIVEVKVRKNGFRELYKWLEKRDFLIVRADRRPPLIILPFSTAVEIARHAEKARSSSSVKEAPTGAQPGFKTQQSENEETNHG
jgi:hypothetical protein